MSLLLSHPHYRLNRQIWAAIAVLALINGCWSVMLGVALDVSHAVIFFYVVAGCLTLSAIYHYLRPDALIWLIGQVTAQMICATAMLGILSYLSAGLNFPLVDETLIAADRALGFNWRDYLAFVNDRPTLARLYTAAYFTSGPQIMVVIGLLFCTKHTLEIQNFLIAFMSAALITIFFAALFPAFGGYVHYDIDVPSQFPNLRPAAARVHELPMQMMRGGTMQTLAFPLEGIVTFPSFHSALAVILTYTCRPVRWLFWVALPLNITVLLSTPTDGGHYLSDILSGVAAAAAAIYIAQRITRPTQTILAMQR